MRRVEIPEALRRQVRDRAFARCEYCLLVDFAALAFEIDHVVALKHGGHTALNNLAYSCEPCNRRKGTDVASVDPGSGSVALLYNPRQDVWADHFRLEAERILGLTPTGRATVALLGLNSESRCEKRAKQIELGILRVPDGPEIGGSSEF